MAASKFAAAALALTAIAAACVSVSAADIGTHVSRTFGLFKELPLTMADASSNGWSQYNADSGCDPVAGYVFAQNTDNSGPSHGSASIVSYTAAGQLNGFGVRVWGNPSQQLISAGYWRASGAGDNSWDMMFTTRDSSLVCAANNATAPELIGDQLNIWGSVQSIALNMTSAEAEQWVMGDCIPKMGIHHAYDLNAPGSQTWNWQSLVPAQPMYDAVTGVLTAVLVNMPDAQLVEPFGEMEGPFINMLFCKNWCAQPACSFSGVTLWSTLHFHLVPIDSISCNGAKCMI